MKTITNNIKLLSLAVAASFAILAGCNKAPADPTPLAIPAAGTGLALGETIAATANDSLYYKLILRSGLLPTFNNKVNLYTAIVPDNNAMRQAINALSGGLVPINAPDPVFVNFINTNITVANAQAIVGYNLVPQVIRSNNIASFFPNMQYPTIVNPAPTVSALLRLTTFPSRRGSTVWINNVPAIGLDATAANGVIHHTAALVAPPSQFLWDRINTDADMTWMKAAILRADSGAVTPGPLQAALQNIGANFTVFVPTNTAFTTILTGLVTQALIAQGMPPATAATTAAALIASGPTAFFSNAALFGPLNATTVKGIVVYHIFDNGEILPAGSRILRPGRAYTVNFPTTATSYPTLLNSAVAVHPGVSLQATFTGPIVTAATVKGAANPSASNIAINPTPAPNGTSDQHYINGVIHKIDQVLRPQ